MDQTLNVFSLGIGFSKLDIICYLLIGAWNFLNYSRTQGYSDNQYGRICDKKA